MIEAEILKKLYVKEGKKQVEIAEILNTTQTLVSYYCKKYKLREARNASKKQKNNRSWWSEKDVEKLEELHGTCSYETIGKMLGRTAKSVETKKNRLGLGESIKATEYLNANELAIALGRPKSTVMRWIKHKGLPTTMKVLNHKRKFHRIDVKKFWKWAYKNSDLMAWEKYIIKSLPNEPQWLLEEKKKINVKSKNVRNRWTETEIMFLRHYYKQDMSLQDIANKLNRTMHSIDQKLVALKIKRKSIRVVWRPEETKILIDMRNNGITFREISEELGRTIDVVQRKYKVILSNQNKSLTY